MNVASPLDLVLKKLHEVARDSVSNKIQSLQITCSDTDPEELVEYINAVDFLKDKKVISGYSKYSQGQEDLFVESRESRLGGVDAENVTLYFIKVNCRLKPKKLIDYMIETSRLPKYTLSFDKQRNLLLNDIYIIKRPHVNSQNFYFIDYALKNPGGIITREAVKARSGNLKSKFHKITNSVMKHPDLVRVFFTNTKKSETVFRNDVTVEDMKGEAIDHDRITAFLATCRKTEL